MTENELKRVTNENRRLRDEAGASEKGIQESKEREIRQLNDKIRTMERDYDELLQKNRVLKCELETYKLRVKSLQEENRSLRQVFTEKKGLNSKIPIF